MRLLLSLCVGVWVCRVGGGVSSGCAQACEGAVADSSDTENSQPLARSDVADAFLFLAKHAKSKGDLVVAEEYCKQLLDQTAANKVGTAVCICLSRHTHTR